MLTDGIILFDLDWKGKKIPRFGGGFFYNSVFWGTGNTLNYYNYSLKMSI